MKLRDSILWGVNSHHRGYPSYRNNTDEAIRLAAEMGSTIYRINFNPTNEEELSYIRNIINQCHDYGMQVMLALDRFRESTTEQIVKDMTFAAENLKDEVEYFQIFNETDIWCSRDENGYYNPTDWTGMSQGYYNPERVPVAVEKMTAALDVFHKVAPNAKLVVNIGSRHYPILDWYIEAGLKWDIIAYDIYDLDVWDHAAFFREMEARYPGYDFMVAECNQPANSGPYTEEQQANWLEGFCTQVNNYELDRMKAVIIYELLDQPSIQKDETWSGEAHFGIVNMNPDNTIAGPKESYYRMQKLIKGE